jgi:hypothetical protein
LTDCNGKCTDLQVSVANCGGCGVTCAAGSLCSGGSCVTSCPAGEYACGGHCVDPQSDPVYCGADSACSGGATCGANQACKAGVCRDLVPPCGWTDRASFPLTSLPLEATVANGGMGGQSAQAVYGRTAWYQTSDWNFLVFPSHLTAADEVFAVEADVYLPAAGASSRYANFIILNDATPGNGGGTHGVMLRLAATSTGTSLGWWFYPTTWGTLDRVVPATFAPAQWHTVRVEGRRSTCAFRAYVDGVLADSFTKACDLAGAKISLVGNSETAQAANTAWSNYRVQVGTAACGP